MLKWMRRLRISLAVKCQLLFGSAVVLIIGAALFVPWRRMQQLTDQLNEKAADAVAQYVVAEHMAHFRAADAVASTQAVADAALSESPSAGRAAARGHLVAPRLLSVAHARASGYATRFEKSSIARFISAQNRRMHDADYLLPDG